MKILKFRSNFLLPVVALLMVFFFSLCNAPTDTPSQEGGAAPPPIITSTEAIPGTVPPNLPKKFNSLDQFHEASWIYFKWLTDTVKSGKLRFETLYNADKIGPDMKPGEGLFLTQSIKDSKSAIMAMEGIRQADSDGILVDQNGRAVYTSIHIDPNYHKFIADNQLYDPEMLQAFAADTNFPTGSFSLKVSWKILDPSDDASKFYVTEANIDLLGTDSNGNIILTGKSKKEKIAMVGFHVAFVVDGHPEFVWATFEHDENSPVLPANALPATVVSDKNYTFYQAQTKAINCNQKPRLTLNESSQELSPSTDVFIQYPYGNIAPYTAVAAGDIAANKAAAEAKKANKDVRAAAEAAKAKTIAAANAAADSAGKEAAKVATEAAKAKNWNEAKLSMSVDSAVVAARTKVFETAKATAAGKSVNPAKLKAAIKSAIAAFKNTMSIKKANKSNLASISDGSVWKNYAELGAIWFNTSKGSLTPEQSFVSTDSILIGSLLLSNSTIETFTQDELARNQCFGCHNTMAIPMTNPNHTVNGKNVLTSHVLVKNYISKRMVGK